MGLRQLLRPSYVYQTYEREPRGPRDSQVISGTRSAQYKFALRRYHRGTVWRRYQYWRVLRKLETTDEGFSSPYWEANCNSIRGR